MWPTRNYRKMRTHLKKGQLWEKMLFFFTADEFFDTLRCVFYVVLALFPKKKIGLDPKAYIRTIRIKRLVTLSISIKVWTNETIIFNIWCEFQNIHIYILSCQQHTCKSSLVLISIRTVALLFIIHPILSLKMWTNFKVPK